MRSLTGWIGGARLTAWERGAAAPVAPYSWGSIAPRARPGLFWQLFLTTRAGSRVRSPLSGAGCGHRLVSVARVRGAALGEGWFGSPWHDDLGGAQ